MYKPPGLLGSETNRRLTSEFRACLAYRARSQD